MSRAFPQVRCLARDGVARPVKRSTPSCQFLICMGEGRKQDSRSARGRDGLQLNGAAAGADFFDLGGIDANMAPAAREHFVWVVVDAGSGCVG